MPVCVRACVSISLEAESLATVSYEVTAVASKLELSGAISATLSVIHGFIGRGRVRANITAYRT